MLAFIALTRNTISNTFIDGVGDAATQNIEFILSLARDTELIVLLTYETVLIARLSKSEQDKEREKEIFLNMIHS